MAGQVLLVCRIGNHVGETVSKIGIVERTIFVFELEARVEADEQGGITSTTYNKCEYKQHQLGEQEEILLVIKLVNRDVSAGVGTCGALYSHASVFERPNTI